MRIKIKDIKPTLIDVSTVTEDDFIIKDWIVEYEIIFSKPNYDFTFLDSSTHKLDIITGTLDYENLPSIKDIIEYLRDRYDKIH